MGKKCYSFWLHYNKPASAKVGKPVITVHWRGACHLVPNVRCDVPTFGYIRATQPRFVMKGWAYEMRLEKDGTAVLC